MIGGEYYINLKPVEDSLLYSLSSLCPNSYTFFSTGRDAIYALLLDAPARRIWLPDFICKSIVDVAVQADKEIYFYPVNEQLLADGEWTDGIQSNDIIFVTHLFGIVQTALLDTLAKTDAVVISDVSHTVFNLPGWQAIASRSTFLVSDLTRTMAVPDGAFVGSQKQDVATPMHRASDEFWVTRAAALLSRGGSANQGFMSDENSKLFAKAELWAESNPAAARKMSDCARSLLATQSEHEWEVQRQHTHHNQAILATHFSDKVICPQVKPTRTLPEIAVSTFFILLLDPVRRDKIRTVLADQRIECPLLWDTSYLNTEHVLSKKILAIPCDARYNNRDMKYIASVILAQL